MHHRLVHCLRWFTGPGIVVDDITLSLMANVYLKCGSLNWEYKVRKRNVLVLSMNLTLSVHGGEMGEYSRYCYITYNLKQCNSPEV